MYIQKLTVAALFFTGVIALPFTVSAADLRSHCDLPAIHTTACEDLPPPERALVCGVLSGRFFSGELVLVGGYLNADLEKLYGWKMVVDEHNY